MNRLLVVADDFTGALDVGVQFSRRGISTVVVLDASKPLDKYNTEVVVVNTNSRHLPASDAYKVVFSITSKGLSCGFSYFYKKTDSALRGNVGSELDAMMDAVGTCKAIFFPGYPEMNRGMKDGILYIDGVPVSESIFGKDPLNPVRESKVEEILREGTLKEIHFDSKASEGILLFNGITSQDLDSLKSVLKLQNVFLFAGCAGFASFLADNLDFNRNVCLNSHLEKNLFVVCGSINPITIKQLEYVSKKGLPRLTLSKKEIDSPLSPFFVNSIDVLLKEKGYCIIDTIDSRKISDFDISCRFKVSERLGEIFKHVLEKGTVHTIMCIGGDTLKAVLSVVNIDEIVPIMEIQPGVVLSKIIVNGLEYSLVSKSGGFGSPELIYDLVEIAQKRSFNA